MITENFTTTILKPEEGHFLTQKEELDIRQRVIASTVALGRYDAPENWIEIDADKAQEYREEQQKAFEEDRLKSSEEEKQ